MVDESKRRRQVFEMVGPDTLRLRLSRKEHSEEDGREAEKWLLEKDAESTATDNKQFRTLLVWAILGSVAAFVAAITGVVAAWPVIKEWVQ